MRSVLASILILAFFGATLTRHHHQQNRRLNNKPAYDDDSDSGFGKFGKGFNFESVKNASVDQSATSGSTLAVGKGNTRISSSIGNHGTINNLKASKGGQSAADFSQVGHNAASSQSLKKGKNGKTQAVDNASNNNYAAKGSNQAAFLGAGAASTGIGVNGVVSDVYGKEGAANANSFNSVLKNQASSQAFAKKGHKKHDDDSESCSDEKPKKKDDDSDSDSESCSDEKPKKRNNRKRDNRRKDHKKKHVGASAKRY
jgi:hypothetical protein